MSQTDESLLDFLKGCFGPAYRQVWVAATTALPAPPREWTGAELRNWVGQPLHEWDARNLYFCIALMEPGSQTRSIGNVAGHWMIVADDIGTKVPREKWDEMFARGFPRPTFEIETSPGNETWGWVFDHWIKKGDPREADVTRVRALLAANGLSDVATVQDPARYIRLPGGHNTKAKYATNGKSPHVELIKMSDDPFPTLDEMGEALAGEDWRNAPLPLSAQPGVKLAAMAGAGLLARTADMNAPEPIIQLAQEIGLAPVQIRAGVVQAICPNAAQHTDGRDDGFAFLGNGLMHCNHDHCQHLTTADFRQMICDAYEAQAPGNSAAGFLAHADFDRHGALTAAGVDAVRVEASEVSEAIETARVRRDMDFASAVKALVQRFVYVRNADVFFDLVERTIRERALIDTHEAVRAVVPYGSTGAKKAVNIVMNHPDLLTVSTYTYEPGSPAIVKTENEVGQIVSAVNLWTPSGIGRRKGTPTHWLRLVDHIFPDQEAKDAFLDWMAWVLQNPSKRTPIVPLLIGDQGTGKDTMLTPLYKVIGRHNVKVTTMQEFKSAFNDWMRHRLIVFDEFKLTGEDTYNQLKAITGNHDNYVTINGKYEKPYKIRPMGVHFAVSNHEDAMQGAEHDDRRTMVYRSPAPKMDADWYDQIATAVTQTDELERVHEYLLTRNLANWKPYGPAPRFGCMKDDIIEESLPAATHWCVTELKEGRFKHRKFITLQEVEEAAATFAPSSVKHKVNSKHAQDALRHAGCRSLGKQMRVGRSKVRLWHGPATKDSPLYRDLLDQMGDDHTRALYQAELAAGAGLI